MSVNVQRADFGIEGSRSARAAMRRSMFLSQDSVVLCMTLRALDRLGILTPSLQGGRALADLYPDLNEAGFGAMRVAMHSLYGAGWIAGAPSLDPETAVFAWTEAGRQAMSQRERYTGIGEMLAGFASAGGDVWGEPWRAPLAEAFLEQVESMFAAAPVNSRPSDIDPAWGWSISDGRSELTQVQLALALVVPLMLSLHETARLGDHSPNLPSDPFGKAAARLLGALGWLAPDDRSWTASGGHARDFALNFGGVLTYLPLFARLPEIYRGELIVSHELGESEWHVHRDLNLRISAAAHRRYFSESEPVFIELFNREPIEAQPRFIADMGCGDGSWLVHLHRAIAERTLRGHHLSDYPLLMVGIDPDPGARAMTQDKLEAAGANALVISGDVTDPDRLANDLAAHGLRIEDGLHIRAFIDHERTYLGDGGAAQVPGWASSVYMDPEGRPLSGEDVERDLIAHLQRWEPHIRRHGLVVLEAHCVAPLVMSKHMGSLHGIAFDAHQAYSKQYPVDHASFLRCCQEARLQPAGYSERRYPVGRPFVSISLNRLLAPADEPPLPGLGSANPREDSWQPAPDTDLEDGRALHEIIFSGSDIRYPALWCTPPTGFVVAGALEAIEKKLASCGPGDTIRVMDYGAGTGTATIELLKACRERGIEQRLERIGATIEIHLVDLPSSWYAQGFELLGDCSWTRFHSLRADRGGFRSLAEVLGGRTMDAAMASMVFHLIPAKALERTMSWLASVLEPGGTLSWSAPDLGPPGEEAVLLHDPNRALRERWLALLDSEDVESLSPTLTKAVHGARGVLDEEARLVAQERADRRIRPRPLASEVTDALAPHFTGKAHSTAYEMLNEKVVHGLLVPSNQAEYLPEIEDRGLREKVIRELMLEEVLPAMQAGPAGTALGLNLHWTLGAFSKRPRPTGRGR